MARRLTREAVVEIAFGGPDDGTPNWATPVSLMGVLQRCEIQCNGETIDLAGAGEDAKRMRYAGGYGFTLTIEGVSATNDPLFYTGASNDTNPIGHYVRVRYKPIAALTNPIVFDGVVREWNASMERYGEQRFRLVMEGPPDT